MTCCNPECGTFLGLDNRIIRFGYNFLKNAVNGFPEYYQNRKLVCLLEASGDITIFPLTMFNCIVAHKYTANLSSFPHICGRHLGNIVINLNQMKQKFVERQILQMATNC